MPASEFVNRHITEHFTEYQTYCRSLYKRRSNMADELLQEFFVYLYTVNEDRLQKYHADGKLKAICKLIIKRMWLRRGRKMEGKQSNPLNEICNLWDVDAELGGIGVEQTPLSENGNKLDLLLDAIRIKLSSDDWFNTSVFLMNHGYTLATDKNTGRRRLEKTKDGPQSLAAIAKEARLNRDQLGKSCKQAAVEIRRYVEQGGSH